MLVVYCACARMAVFLLYTSTRRFLAVFSDLLHSIYFRLLGEDRSIVSEVAGTTRDIVDALLVRGNQTYRFLLILLFYSCLLCWSVP